MRLGFIPFALLVVPIIEIGAFLVIGNQIGIAATLLMIVVTAIIGTILLRIQGFALLTKIQNETAAGRVPGRALGDGAMILVAGILLLTPGFVTDTIGFSLFIPFVRNAIWSFIASRITVVGPGGMTFGAEQSDEFYSDHPSSGQGGRSRSKHHGGPTIDLDEDEFHSEPASPEDAKKRKDSPWRADKADD